MVCLAGSGGRVEIPHAVECVDTVDSGHVSFLDSKRTCLVRFSRADVAIFTSPEQADLIAEAVDGDGIE